MSLLILWQHGLWGIQGSPCIARDAVCCWCSLCLRHFGQGHNMRRSNDSAHSSDVYTQHCVKVKCCRYRKQEVPFPQNWFSTLFPNEIQKSRTLTPLKHFGKHATLYQDEWVSLAMPRVFLISAILAEVTRAFVSGLQILQFRQHRSWLLRTSSLKMDW